MRDIYLYWTYWLDPFFLVYFASINLFYTALLFFGVIKIVKRRNEIKNEDFTYLLKTESMPAITFLVPAYNEESGILPLVSNLVNLSYRHKRIIIINDGSTDATFELLKNYYQLKSIPKYYRDKLNTMPVKGIYRSLSHPDLIVIDKYNGMKYDALDAGLNACSTHYFITVDADTFVDDAQFEAMIRPILSSPLTMGVGGTVRIRNGCTLRFNKVDVETIPLNFVTGMQTLEYLRSFIMRQGWDYMGGNFIIAGAFSVFPTNYVRDIGGYGPTVADDLEIVLRMNRTLLASKTPFEIFYLPDPVAWTEAPATLKELSHQRYMWQRGSCEAIWFNKCMLFNPRYGLFAFLAFPFLIFGEILEAIVELLGMAYIVIGLVVGVANLYFILLLMATVWGFNLVFTIACRPCRISLPSIDLF